MLAYLESHLERFQSGTELTQMQLDTILTDKEIFASESSQDINALHVRSRGCRTCLT